MTLEVLALLNFHTEVVQLHHYTSEVVSLKLEKASLGKEKAVTSSGGFRLRIWYRMSIKYVITWYLRRKVLEYTTFFSPSITTRLFKPNNSALC